MPRRMDEMEMSFNLRAVRLAWVYSLVFLFVWVVADWLWKGTFNGLGLILFSSQLIVYWAAQLVFKRRLGRVEE